MLHEDELWGSGQVQLSLEQGIVGKLRVAFGGATGNLFLMGESGMQLRTSRGPDEEECWERL